MSWTLFWQIMILATWASLMACFLVTYMRANSRTQRLIQGNYRKSTCAR
jgi:hypothetical protein